MSRAELALIGNCAYQALIDTRGHVRWLCWPRFDSSFVFGSLLDEQQGGAFSVEPVDAHARIEQRYLDNTNILRTVFSCGDGVLEVIDFAPRFEDGAMERPLTLMRIVRRVSGTPRVRIHCAPRYDYGRQVPQRVGVGTWRVAEFELRLQTAGVDAASVEQGVELTLVDDVHLSLSWGEAVDADVARACEGALARTRQHWEQWVAGLTLPPRFQAEVIRSALALKLHQHEATGAITAAATTSVPEHPGSGRNWDYRYCWLRDAFFTLEALSRLGQRAEREAYAAWLRRVVAASDQPVRLQPLCLQPLYGIAPDAQLEEAILPHLSGYRGDGPVRIGNAAYQQVQYDVYGEAIASLLGSSDVAAVMAELLARIDETMELPDAGLWEIRDHPKLHTFSLLMHWYGASVVARAELDEGLTRHGRRLAARARELIESRCRRDGYYADAATTDHADAATLMLINLGYLDGEREIAAAHVDAMAERLRVTDFLLKRYAHDDGLGETHSTFTVCGFWYAEALARTGRRDEAERCLQGLLRHANHVGLYSEDVDPATGEQWGNFPQTYSHVGLIQTAFALADDS